MKALNAHAVELELAFEVPDVALVAAAQSELFDLAFLHAKAVGLILSPPAEAGVSGGSGTAVATHRNTPLRLLDALPLFGPLTDDEKEALASTMIRTTFRAGELLAEQDAVLDGLAASPTICGLAST